MELDELDRRAYAMQVLPAGLSPPERYYFLTMRALYAMFATGRLTGEQARQEKRAVLEAYRQLDLQYRVGQQELRVLWEVQQRGDYYRKNGCSVCRQLASQLCGLNPSILKGSLKVAMEDHIEVLREGDAIYYDSGHGHGMIAAGGEECVFLAVVLKREKGE